MTRYTYAVSLIAFATLLSLAPSASFAESLVGKACRADEVGVTKMDTNRTGIVGCFVTEEGASETIWKAAYPTIPVTTQRRYVFTTSQAWTVPMGVANAFVTMAGGGGSGSGWRFSNAHISGHSGGYVFSHPVTLVPGETLAIEVGKGANVTGYNPYLTNVPVTVNPGHKVWAPPAKGDLAVAGFPGTASKITSSVNGVLLLCSGGSGALPPRGLDTNNGGGLVPGPQNGATWGSGLETIPVPVRTAAGPYTAANQPGACGEQSYGIGNPGESRFTTDSGTYAGGSTPFGYGSGGAAGIHGCYVSPTTRGMCRTFGSGRDGVVIIDLVY